MPGWAHIWSQQPKPSLPGLPTRTIAALDPHCYYPVVVRKGVSLPDFPAAHFTVAGLVIREAIRTQNAHRQSVENGVADGLSEDPSARLPDLGFGSQYAIPGQADAASLDLNQNKSQKYKHYEVFGALINAP